MLSLDQLSQQVAACHAGRISLDDFEEWFRTNSKGAYRASEDLSRAAASVEAAFSKYCFQGLDEQGLREELAEAVRPSAEPVRVYAPAIDVVYGEPLAEAGTASSLLRLVFAVS